MVSSYVYAYVFTSIVSILFINVRVYDCIPIGGLRSTALDPHYLTSIIVQRIFHIYWLGNDPKGYPAYHGIFGEHHSILFLSILVPFSIHK